MTHFGVICPPVSSHIKCFVCVGRELQKRGHRITFFNILDVQEKVQREGFDFYPLGVSDHPRGSLENYLAQLGKLSGLAAMRLGITTAQTEAEMICRDAPEALQKLGIEAVLVDQGEPAGATVAEFLNLPFISISCAIAGNREPFVPSPIMPWSYQTAWWAVVRNQIGYFLFDWFTQPIAKVVAKYRKQWQLTPYKNFEDSFSPLAQICQQTADFDFPRQHLPSCFHYIGGLFASLSSQQIAFPFEQLDGRPLIYASMGTLQNRLLWIFPMIAEACVGLDAQLVITLGGGEAPESLPELPGNPIVVGYAPQLELLQRATLTITHSGINTVLESLRYGVPMVAIPITNDQPGTAARIQFTGVGEAIMLKQLTVSTLHKTIKKVMEENSYRDKANQLQESISQAGGVVRAADIIEQAVATRKPILAV